MQTRGLAVVASILFASTVAFASPPSKVVVDIDFTRLAVGTSMACGFPVFVRAVGTVQVTLFHDAGGHVIKELDTFPGFRTIFFAPTKETSYEFPSGPNTYHYPDGAYLGASVTVIVNGSLAKVPGVAADAGRMTFTGVVIDFTPEGIPVVDFDLTSPDTATGHFGSDTRANRCAALDP